MKRLLFIILLIACATLVSHGYIVVDGVHYSTYWAGSVQEAVVVFGDPDDPNNENNYAGLVHANIRDSVSFDGITKLPVTRIGFTAFQWAPDLEEVTIPNTVKTEEPHTSQPRQGYGFHCQRLWQTGGEGQDDPRGRR